MAEIIGMRHRLIHGYAEVRLDLVWMVARERLAPLVSALEPLIPKEGASSE
ncbi:MAG: HepT-like ribonuclease domain-containing protein [Rhodomicrobium sp.]